MIKNYHVKEIDFVKVISISQKIKKKMNKEFIRVYINNKPVTLQLDTSSDITIISIGVMIKNRCTEIEKKKLTRSP